MERGSWIREARDRRIFPHRLSWLIDNPVRRLVISPESLADRLDLSSTCRVLEVGPGSGFFSVELARRIPQGKLTLLDLQPEMLAKARRKLESFGLVNVQYTCADAGRGLPFPNGHFDAALLVSVLGEVREPQKCLRSLHRVLKTGGVLAFHEAIPDPDRIPFTQLLSQVQAEGFAFQRRWGFSWNYTATFGRSEQA